MTDETPDVPEFDFDAEFAKAFGPKKPVRSVIVAGIAQARALADLLPAHDVKRPRRGRQGHRHRPRRPRPGDGGGEQDVQTLSAAVPQAEFVLFTVGEESIEGQTWTGGTRGEDPRPGLLLSVWPDLVQDLVLGKADPAEHAVGPRSPARARSGSGGAAATTTPPDPPRPHPPSPRCGLGVGR